MTRHLLKAWRHLTALLKQLNGQTVSFITRFANHLTAHANRTATPAAHPDHRTRKIDPNMDRERLAQELKSDEGIIPHAYQDHLGYWTIGVGRLIDRRKGGGLRIDNLSATPTYFNNNYGVQFAVRNSVTAPANRIEVGASTTGNAVPIYAEGSDANIDIALIPKGTGKVRFGTHQAGSVTPNGYIEFKLADGATVRINAYRV